MCTAVQAISRNDAGVPRSGKAVQRCACKALADVICGSRVLPANGTGKKMRIYLANAIDIRRDFDALKASARKCAAPVICSQKARIRPNFGIYLDVGKTLQDLKHQFRVDRLIGIGSQAFADHQPAIARQSRASLIQAKQKILGDMQHVDGVYEIELARSYALNIPRQIE